MCSDLEQKSRLYQYHTSLKNHCSDHVFSLLDSTWHTSNESACVKGVCAVTLNQFSGSKFKVIEDQCLKPTCSFEP